MGLRGIQGEVRQTPHQQSQRCDEFGVGQPVPDAAVRALREGHRRHHIAGDVEFLDGVLLQGDKAGADLCGPSSALDVVLMHVAPAPRLSGLHRLHDRVIGGKKVRVRVPHR